MYATNYFEVMILNTLRGTKAAAPSAVFVGLFLTNPTDGGQGTEIAYSGYERQPISFSAPAAMENGIGIQNSADITFPTAPSAAGTVTYLGLFDAKTSGNMLAYGALSSPQGVEAGEAPVIVAGEAKWYLTGNMSAYFKAAVLNILRGQSLEGFSPYLALYNGSPDAAGTELSGGGYQRQELSFSAPEQQSGNECSIATDSAVQTARATAAWGTWAQTVIMDAAEGGHAIFYKEKSPAKVMRKGLLVMIDPGNLSLTVN